MNMPPLATQPDNNLYSIEHQRPLGRHVIGDLIATVNHDDALKITDSAAGEVLAGHVVGGREDCVDVNNKCQDLVIEADRWEPRGKYLATIKGASRNITLRGTVRGHGSVVDVDLGNISDQTDDGTGPVTLDLVHESGDAITVRVLHASKPILQNSDVQPYYIVLQLPGFWGVLFTKVYKFLKKLGLPI